MTDLLLVRHAATVWSQENRYAGATDVALSEAGRDQARALAPWAAGARLAAVWCSPLTRARETAQAAVTGLGLAVHVDARLAELDFGAGEGLTAAQMRERFPEQRDAYEHDPAAHPLPGGEPPSAALARASACLEEIAAASAASAASAATGDARVLVVTHIMIIRLLVCDALGIPLRDYRRRLPAIGHTALTELRLGAGERALLRFNAPARIDEPLPASRIGAPRLTGQDA